MSSLNITADQFRTTRQQVQGRFIKIELLNYQYQTVDSLEGVCVGGNLNIQADSDIRRTGNVDLVVKKSTFNIQPGGQIWLDKYLKIFTGIRSIRTGEITWTKCGTYIIDAPKFHYDLVSNTLSISLLDLMAKMTGARNGYLRGFPVSFPAGTDIREAMVGMIKLAGFTKYIITTPPGDGKVPFDLEFGQGATVYSVLKGLADLYPGYEIFFDLDGTFIYQKIPSGENDPVLVDDTTWNDVVLSEDVNVDFQGVKNSIEVFGHSHDPARFSTKTTVAGNEIHLSIADVYHYFDDLIYGFTLTDNPGYSGMNLEINELGPLPIYEEDGKTPAKIPSEQGEVYYCVQYKVQRNEQGDIVEHHWLWLGHLQPYGMAEDTNPDSPFYVNGPVGRISLPLFGGVYDNIYTDELAKERAEYELYLHANMNDTVTLSCVPVYWLDVNIKVAYTSKRTEKKEFYIVKAINSGFAPGDAMSVTLMKFYPNIT